MLVYYSRTTPLTISPIFRMFPRFCRSECWRIFLLLLYSGRMLSKYGGFESKTGFGKARRRESEIQRVVGGSTSYGEHRTLFNILFMVTWLQTNETMQPLNTVFECLKEIILHNTAE